MNPTPRPPLNFTVNFDEADGEGIVFFGNYFRLAHRAMEQFLPQLQIPWTEWFSNSEWAVPLRHVEAEYLKPLRPGDAFSVRITVAEIGESAVHFDYDLRDAHDQPVAKLKTSHVFIDRASFKKLAIPPDVRKRLEHGS